MSKKNQLLTPREVAEQLTDAGIPISDEAVRGWVRSGRLQAITLPSGRVRIEQSAVRKIIEGAAV